MKLVGNKYLYVPFAQGCCSLVARSIIFAHSHLPICTGFQALPRRAAGSRVLFPVWSLEFFIGLNPYHPGLGVDPTSKRNE